MRNKNHFLIIFIILLIIFILPYLVSSSQPSYTSCNNSQGIIVYPNANISGDGCNNINCMDESEGGTCSIDSWYCYGQWYNYTMCDFSAWGCGILTPGDSLCIEPSGTRYIELPKSPNGNIFTFLTNKGYFYDYNVANCEYDYYRSRWDVNFRKCVEIVNDGTAKAVYHGFLIGDECSEDDETVSISYETNKWAEKKYCGTGSCEYPPVGKFTFCNSNNDGQPITVSGCPVKGATCYKGWNDANENGDSEETKGYCDKGECKNLNFWIDYVTPIQVLEGFDWVKNKPGMVRAKAGFSDALNPDKKEENVKVKLYLWKEETGVWVKKEEWQESGTILKNATLRQIKKGEDSINLFDMTISEPGTYKFEAIIDPSESVLESNEGDNTKNSSEFNIRTQIDDDFKVQIILVYSVEGPDVYGIGSEIKAVGLARRSFEFMVRVAPFDPTKTRILPFEKLYQLYSIHVNSEKLDNKDSSYTASLRRKIAKELNKIAKDWDIDLVFGMIMDERIMWDGSTYARGFRVKSFWRDYNNVILINRNTHSGVAVHEYGHILGLYTGGNEEYDQFPNHGKLASPGWSLDQGIGIGQKDPKEEFGRRINIWTTIPSGGFSGYVDFPEHLPYDDPVKKNPENYFRPPIGRFYNIMGNPEYPYIWVEYDTYSHFLNKLTQ